MCARSGRRVFACVFSSTDISSNVVDISKGFEDLIPSVFEELCAALLKTPRKTLQQSQQRALPLGALLHSIWSSPFSLTRSVIKRRPALYIACLFRADWFTAWSFTWSCCFPLSCGVFLLLSTEAEKISPKDMREVDSNGVGGSERERMQESVREREGEICFSCYRLVSGAN